MEPWSVRNATGSCRSSGAVKPGSPALSASMFAAGLAGNVLALGLLALRRRRRRRKRKGSPVFHVLLAALVVTDLLGTLSTSPVVLAAYLRNESLTVLGGGGGGGGRGRGGGGEVCSYFGITMTFFSLATLSILLAMAVERWLSIGHPYFYEKHVTKRCGYLAVPVLYLLSLSFCVLPQVGLGEIVQYCPGTWCFFDMHPETAAHRAYAGLYALVMLLMITCTVLCNVSVIYHLLAMFKRRRPGGSSRQGSGRRSVSREAEHLLLLVVMTVSFLVFSLPLVIKSGHEASASASQEKKHKAKLDAISRSQKEDMSFDICHGDPSLCKFFQD
ncbi:prostaglandin E2 receptor EP2 subtype-like isoform X2 [Denticeps clupeoides]|uniref:G-protein coupled receptors family 1 profile domain-containing protein n=1 Tax=Denticeps clupeoides TaxID=299321 RepID=A0AAY4CVZ3_9TELE|nr:prostaglandin E2 receptor EP2 subtype-like isoform X2 [Denticeps clupeoides]